MIKCSVLRCKNQVKFKFPKNAVMRKKWLAAMRRTKFNPKDHNGLCKVHFASSDIVTLAMKTKGPNRSTFECLRGNAVPCYFPWNEEVVDQSLKRGSSIIKCMEIKNSRASAENLQTPFLSHVPIKCDLNENTCDPLIQDKCADSISSVDSQQMDESYNGIHDSDDIEILTMNPELIKIELNQNDDDSHNEQNRSFQISQYDEDKDCPEFNTRACQTESVPRYSIEQFKQDTEALSFFTGLQNYEQFMTIFYLLGPSINHLNYVHEWVENISLPNQLLLVLWKLKKNSCDTELAHHFCVQKMSVRNIFASFIIFMSKQWSLMNGWPSQDLIDFCLPKGWSDNYSFYLNSINQAQSINNQKKKLYQVQMTKNERMEVKRVELMNQLLKNYKETATNMDQDYMILAREIIGVCLMLCHFKAKLNEDSEYL